MTIPQHIAIIPDGNRRWAKAKGLLSFEGHKQATEKTIPELLEKAAELGVKYITFWALSTENLTKREKDEVNGLFTLGKMFLKKRLDDLHKNGVRVKCIGNLPGLPEDIQETIKKAIETTKYNTKITFIIAINYGGRDEIMRAMQKVMNMRFLAGSVNKENFFQFLDTNGTPDPDLIIRTGGEQRLSGFMLWQCEYSEFYFSDLLFPDFNGKELEKAVDEFSARQRRFGK
jgi:undecaprenyl diphosphate synthase